MSWITDGRRLAVVHPGVGAPNAASRLEQMIALGCRKFIACGGAGVLDGAIGAGHIVVPDGCDSRRGDLLSLLVAGARSGAYAQGAGRDRGGVARKPSRLPPGQDLDHRRGVPRDARAAGAAAARRMCGGGYGGGRFLRGGAFSARRIRANPLRRRQPCGPPMGHPRGWNRNAMRERLFHLAAESCLRL